MGAYYAGGLIGYSGSTTTITNCYTTGNLIGYGGNNVTIINCYVAGTQANLKNGEWIIANLGWDAGIWAFADGEFPTLK
jgi:hypothetical protein